VLPVPVTVSQFEQQANIKIVCKLGKLTVETLVGLNTIYADKALKISAVYVSFLHILYTKNYDEFWEFSDPSMYMVKSKDHLARCELWHWDVQ
jgi:hypothetical protein